MAKKIDIEILLERIEALESRLDKLDPVSKRKLPNKKDQISDIKNNLDEWSQKFPSVDIEFELLKMLDWLQANQKRKKDYKAFFRNWLRKASNSIEKEVQDVYRYIYGCSTNKDCKHQESEYKDMVIFCNKCNTQKKIIGLFLEIGFESLQTQLKKMSKMFIDIFMGVKIIKTVNIKSLNTKIWLFSANNAIRKKRLLNR